MTRYERFEYLRDKGWTYNPETGEIFNSRGKVCSNFRNDGYVRCGIAIRRNKKLIFHCTLLGHHFAWLWMNGNVEINQIDHINRNRADNRICNLRNVTNQVNTWNRNGKGYYFNKVAKKYQAQITLNNNVKYLGRYNTPEEAREAYLNAKQKYHVI